MCAVSSDGSGSGYFETTYSQDERIEKEINAAKNKEKAAKYHLDLNRKREFERFFAEKNHDIFNFAGLHFIKFTHRKVKFRIVPSEIRDFISKRIWFYCSLQYLPKEEYWVIRRETFPVDHKLRLRNFFTRRTIDDESLLHGILQLYKYFTIWARDEENRNIDRQKKYRNGEISDVDLGSEDEELFLDDEDKENLFQRRQAILKRMIPPSPPVTISRPRRRKKRRVIEEDEDSS